MQCPKGRRHPLLSLSQRKQKKKKPQVVPAGGLGEALLTEIAGDWLIKVEASQRPLVILITVV